MKTRQLASRSNFTILAAFVGSFAMFACSTAEDTDNTESAMKCADGTDCAPTTDPVPPIEPTPTDPAETTITCYIDKDKDGLGSVNSPKSVTGTSCPSGYVAKAGDCDDSDASWQGLKCYTDNDKDGVGGTLEPQLYCSSKTTCPSGHTAKAGECGSLSSCFEKTAKSTLLLSYFSMKLSPNDGGDAITSGGSIDNLNQSRVIGSMAVDGTFKFLKSDFIVKEVHEEENDVYGTLIVTTSIAATADVTAKVSPSTGAFDIFSVPAKVSINVKKKSETNGSGKTCTESSVALKLKSSSSAPYNSSNGSFTLITSESFAVDNTTGTASDLETAILCGTINSYLPAKGTLTINAQALDPRPIASWPALVAYNPGTAK